MNNKGYEINAKIDIIKRENFNFGLNMTYSKNKNVVTSVPGDRVNVANPNSGAPFHIITGEAIGVLYGTYYATNPDGTLLLTNLGLPQIERGNVTTNLPLRDANGQPTGANLFKVIGDPNPDWKLGITNTVTFKGVTISTLWDMTKGGDFFSETVTSLLGRGVTRDTEDREKNRVIAGVYADPNNIYAPLLVGGKTVPNQTRISTNDLFFSTSSIAASFAINGHDEFNVFDGTVYRLRELTLGYDLPKNFVRKMKLSAISLSLSGRNLWYMAPNIPKHTRYDPETNSLGNGNLQGIELSAAPTAKRFGFNLNVTF